MDVAVPIVFPDYLIAVNTPPVTLQMPHIGHGLDFFPNVVRIPGTNNRLPELGHAGILIINGANGLTKYYEYGRYDRANLGLTRRVPVRDVVLAASPPRRPTSRSLAQTLHLISATAGQRGRIRGAYIEVPPGKFHAMLVYCQKRVRENSDPHREPYSLTGHSCIHFAQEVLEAGDVDVPWMIDPRPIGYMDRLQSDFPALNYEVRTNSLAIEGLELPESAIGPARHALPAGRR